MFASGSWDGAQLCRGAAAFCACGNVLDVDVVVLRWQIGYNDGEGHRLREPIAGSHAAGQQERANNNPVYTVRSTGSSSSF